MNHKALESFIEKIDGEVVAEEPKVTPQSKLKDSIATVAKSMKQQLEEGLKEIDDLDPVERSCGLIALQKKMQLGKEAFSKLVDNLVRMTEQQPPKTFKAL